jgi:murein DD-endopeptidase MepM/ murein hydrolase activator NlpD
MNTALEPWLPERRLFVKTETETRFVRLRPLTQLAAFAGAAAIVGWSIVATAILAMDTVGSGNLRDHALREKARYETRLSELAADRDAQAEAARVAQERFDLALARMSGMQSALLEADNRRRELEAGIDVIQTTLRRTLRERDAAREERTMLLQALGEAMGSARSEAGQLRDLQTTVELLSAALSSAAEERDAFAAMALQARAEAEHLALERVLHEQRTDAILARLEEAVSVSMAPLERVFRTAGLSPDSILRDIRRSRAGQEAALTPLSRSTRGTPSDAELRADGIIGKLDEVNLYRLAMQRLPFAKPVWAAVRFTSGFGMRSDPKTGRPRMHEGIDYAGPTGTAILSTGDGVVREAGWHAGFGNRVVIEHDFGITTLYAHLSRIRVTVGQRVSRGERIGDMGNTGRSTGTHLHYEVHVGGRPVNPMTYIRAANDVF